MSVLTARSPTSRMTTVDTGRPLSSTTCPVTVEVWFGPVKGEGIRGGGTDLTCPSSVLLARSAAAATARRRGTEVKDARHKPGVVFRPLNRAEKRLPAWTFCRLQDRNRRDTDADQQQLPDRKSTRLNSSHLVISYDVFC